MNHIRHPCYIAVCPVAVTTEEPITTLEYRNEPAATTVPCNLTFPPDYPPKMADILCKKSQDMLNGAPLGASDSFELDEGDDGDGDPLGTGVTGASDNFDTDLDDGDGNGGQGDIHKLRPDSVHNMKKVYPKEDVAREVA